MPRGKKRLPGEEGDSRPRKIKKPKLKQVRQAAENQQPRETIKLKDSPFVGTLLFSGGTNWDLIGRNRLPKAAASRPIIGGRNLWGPHRLSALDGIRVRNVHSGPSSCHSVIITEEGKAMTWGRNDREQLGHGDDYRRDAPTLVEGLKDHHIVTASCGRNHTMCLTDEGTVFSFGDNRMGQCGIGVQSSTVGTPCKPNYYGSPIVKVACGADFSMILDCKGVIHSFGSQEYSQLGHNTNGQYSVTATKLSSECVSTPKKVTCFLEKGREGIKYIESTVIKDIACGNNHSIAIDMQNRVFTWGFGGYGRLGHQKPDDEPVPRSIKFFDMKGVAKINAGSSYSMAVTEHGQLYFWGQAKTSGEATMYPKPVHDLIGWKVRSMGCSNHSIVIAADDDVISWGPFPTYGELAYGEGDPRSSTTAKRSRPLENIYIHHLTCGSGHSLFIARDETETDKEELAKLPVFTPGS
ncbi:protein RCC2 homolog [Lytechinus variegatus]|uniref:protein RCC2 homolog n=1 Tax=Lytechinus variegatus TaxID=7654 RepID=UPI001BB22A0A|nr:protein RCC2 homolog [Lytechinus variegatus]